MIVSRNPDLGSGGCGDTTQIWVRAPGGRKKGKEGVESERGREKQRRGKRGRGESKREREKQGKKRREGWHFSLFIIKLIILARFC